MLNGGSSSGKTSIARELQAILPEVWLTFGVDTLGEALPPDRVIVFEPDGTVVVRPEYRALEAAWISGIAAMARAGARIVVDEVFLGGARSQKPWQDGLAGLEVLWVGVRCDPGVAAARERARGDRVTGMAASQAVAVHEGVTYDLEVDTGHADVRECAARIAAAVR